MEMHENIITIRNRDINEANKAFDEFMVKAENCFNERSSNDPNLYKGCSPLELERITERLLKDVCPSTPFLPEDIKLVSGHSFPDIMATDFYGVEVKSTSKNKWTSTGSSIVELTRNVSVERIYMLFGNLGNNPPAFRCRPYQECLSNIAVTHSPRYLIDMCLDGNNSILSKMNIDYDSFRALDEKSKIAKVRSYFKQKAKSEKKIEMPWWMGDSSDSEQQINNINLSIFSDQDADVKTDLKRRAFILFASIYDKDTSVRYKQIALWLCNRYSLICHNVRDLFTAGGMICEINGKRLSKPYPKIVGNLLDYKEGIVNLLKNPDYDIVDDIKDYWDFDYDSNDYYTSWINMVETAFHKNPDLNDIPIRELLK